MKLQSILVLFILLGIMYLCTYYAVPVNNTGLNGKYPKRSFFQFNIIFPILLFAIVFGIRYDYGTDHLHYLSSYIFGANREHEIGFTFITDIFKKNNIHYTFYFGTLALIQIFFLYYAFKNEIFLLPLLTFYIFTSGEVWSWMNLIRHSVAVCIWIYSINFIVEKKFIKYCLCCGICMLFHKSALLLFLIYPLIFIEKPFRNVKLQLILLIVVFIVRGAFWSLYDKITPIINGYSDFLGYSVDGYIAESLNKGIIDSGGTMLAFIAILIVNILIIIKSNQMRTFYNSNKFNIFYFLYFVGLLFFYIIPKGYGGETIMRPFIYFYSLRPVMFAFFTYYLIKDKSSRYNHLLSQIMIILFIGIYTLSILTATEDSHRLFRFFFQQNHIY